MIIGILYALSILTAAGIRYKEMRSSFDEYTPYPFFFEFFAAILWPLWALTLPVMFGAFMRNRHDAALEEAREKQKALYEGEKLRLLETQEAIKMLEAELDLNND